MKAATPEVRLLKVGSCTSVTGKSKLTYHLGCDPSGALQLCIHANTGGGYFNSEWVPLTGILQVLDKAPANKPLTSHALYPLFRGKSANTPAFLLAALKSEGLVQASKDKQRSYERVDPKGFLAGARALMDAKAAPQKTEGKPKPTAPAKKAPSKSTQKKKA